MKIIKAFIIASVAAFALAACGESVEKKPSPSPTAETQNESLANDAGNAAKDIADGAGDIVKDAGDAVSDAGNAADNAVKDLTK